MVRPVVVVLIALALLTTTGCGRQPSATSEGGGAAAPTPAPPASSRQSQPPAGASRPVRSTPATPRTASPTANPTPRCPAAVPTRLSLNGEQDRAFAFAPLDDPGEVTVEGDVGGAEAWSTSKVLVAAAFLATTAGGDPNRVSPANRRLITAALTRSDGDAVRSLRDQIPGSPGRAMTSVLRSIGDRRTSAPDSLEGTMSWTPREQVRFMAALEAGEVVSGRASAYLLDTMRPIEQHRWGLGTVGANAFKGGWLRQGRVTRQMGLLDGYAVALITDEGPVARQTDGDSAHVEAMDDLAALLAERLDHERRCG